MKQLAVALLFAAAAFAQDVHVNVAAHTSGSTASAASFSTIQQAMDHAPQPGPGGRLYVHIAPGRYVERVMITANRPRTTFLGDAKEPSMVTIAAAQNAKSAGGTFFSETVDVEAPEFEADGITFANDAGATGQAVAIAVRSDKAVFKHCRFVGDQDTLFADYGRQYYVDSYIAGGVDFIFGDAAAVFDRVEIHEQRAAYLTAQSRTSPGQATGFVIINSAVTSEMLDGRSFYLGRPWRPYARVVVMKTSLPKSLDPGGWSPWRKNETPAHAFFAEYKNNGPGAGAALRVPWMVHLTERAAQRFSPKEFLRGADRWDAMADAGKLP